MPPSAMPTTRNVVMFLASNGLPPQLATTTNNTSAATTTAATALAEILSGMFPPGSARMWLVPRDGARPGPGPVPRLLQGAAGAAVLVRGTSVVQVLRVLRSYWILAASTAGSRLTVVRYSGLQSSVPFS